MKADRYGFVYVTAPSLKEATRLADLCIRQNLAACANIYPSVLSVYKWKNKLLKEKEVVLILKTRAALFSKLHKALKKHHSYTCPCVVFVPFSKGDGGFLSWIKKQTQFLSG